MSPRGATAPNYSNILSSDTGVIVEIRSGINKQLIESPGEFQTIGNYFLIDKNCGQLLVYIYYCIWQFETKNVNVVLSRAQSGSKDIFLVS